MLGVDIVRDRQLREYALLMRLHRPIGIWLLLWPALWALWIAGDGRPDANLLLIFVGGVVVMRSAGCVINDYADRNFDAHVERTRNRPLAGGALRPAEALALAGVLLLAAFFLVLQLNWLAVSLSFVALGLTVIYPFLKRFFVLPQAWLGIAFGFFLGLLLVLLAIAVIQHLHFDAVGKLARLQFLQRFLDRPQEDSRVSARAQVPPLDDQLEIRIRFLRSNDAHRLAGAMDLSIFPAPGVGIAVDVDEVALAERQPTGTGAVDMGLGQIRRFGSRQRAIPTHDQQASQQHGNEIQFCHQEPSSSEKGFTPLTRSRL